jgi:hypothetical protein
VFDEALVEDEDPSEGGEPFGRAFHLPPVLPQDDGGGPADLAHFDLPHFDGVHEHGHDETHSATKAVGNCGLTDAIALKSSQGRDFCVEEGVLYGLTGVSDYCIFFLPPRRN